MPSTRIRFVPCVLLVSGILAGVGAGARIVPLSDGDMEQADTRYWARYGTPVTIEKSNFARTGKRALHVITDNLKTMGGNYEGTSRFLGEFHTGDTLHISFWFRTNDGRNLVIGIGTTYFMRRQVLDSTDWTRADITFRVPRIGRYNIWISQHGAATEFFVDDFTAELEERPELRVVPSSRRVVLETAPLRLLLDRDTGALCGIVNKAIGQVAAPEGRCGPLFRLERLTDEGMGFEHLPFAAFKLDALDARSPRDVHLDFHGTGRAVGVTVAVRISLTFDGAAEFAGSVRNDSKRPVTAVALPTLYGVCPAADARELTLVDPHVCGRIVPNALHSDGCRTMWPGRGVMGWMDLSGEKGGLYLATHDRGGTGTRLTALPAPGDTFDMAITKEVVVAPGTALDLPPAVLAVHAGDWHAAADRYRAWFRSWAPPPDVPTWLRNCDGWVLTGIQNGIPFRRLPDIYRSAEWMGIDFLHVQGEGIDNMWFDANRKRHHHAMTYPFPSPKFGTPKDVIDAVRRIHDRAGHVMFYFLFERWTPSHSTSDDFGTGKRADVPPEFLPPGPDFYKDNALVTSAGTHPPAEHPFMAERVMCLASPGWQEWMRHWAIDVYAKRFGADGLYWDVMGRRGPFRCFNTRHGHHGRNEWASGCAKVLDTVLRQGRVENPDYSCAIEGCSDFLSPWVGFHLMSGGTHTPNVFRYTFPEVLCVDGFSNTIWKLTQLEKARRVFLDGERFDLHGMHQAVRPILLLRKRIKPFIDWPAVFRDTVGIAISDPRVQARIFRRMDAGNAVLTLTLMNEAGVKGATVAVDTTGLDAVRTAHIFRLGGRVLPFPVRRDAQGRVLVPVPEDPIAAAVLVDRVSPNLAVWAWLEQILRPGDDGLALTYFFPDGHRRPVDLKVSLPDGLAGQFQPVPAVSPCVERRELRDPQHLGGLKRWHRVNARIRCGGAVIRPWTVIAPPLVNGDFEAVDSDGRLVYWGAAPCMTEPGQGRRCIQMDAENMPFHYIRLLTPLKPNTRYRFRCMLKRDTGASGGVGAHMVEYLEGSHFVRSAALNARSSGKWETLETTFTSHPAPRSSAVYLYNFDKTRPAWFDAIELEEVRGARE